jgi:hypothetical protein
MSNADLFWLYAKEALLLALSAETDDESVTVTLRRLPVENWIGYLSPYIIFGLEHRCLGKNVRPPEKPLSTVSAGLRRHGEKAANQTGADQRKKATAAKEVMDQTSRQ